jgi:environmental stress-induced protein Ves
MKTYTNKQFKVMPWKNGLGMTTEMVKLSTGTETFFRISRARVDSDGPFSLFEGMDRYLMILQGSGLWLSCADFPDAQLTQDSGPYFFSGDKKIQSSLIKGPVEDFNVMVKRGYARVEIQRFVTGEFSDYTCEDDRSYIYQIETDTLVELSKGETINQFQGHGIIIDLKINSRP